MKNATNILLSVYGLLFLFIPLTLISQVDTNFYQYRNYFYQGQYGITDTNEASIITQFKKYEYFKGSRFSPTGSLKFAGEQYHKWISDYELNGDGTTPLTSSWESIGPHNTPSEKGINDIDFTRGVGRLICISLDPNNPEDTIYTGSPFGGAWKTYNGGQNWSNMNTDFLPVTKCSDIAINPSNKSMIFIATGDRDDYHNASISAGVYRSTDAGLTWTPVNSGLDFSGFYQISKILINPSNPDVLYLATSRGIYKTTNATAACTWVQLTDPLVYQQYFRNVTFKADGLYSTIYASGKDIIMSTNGGASWASMTGIGTGLDFSTFTNYPYPHRINITVSPAAPNKLFAYGAFSDSPNQINYMSVVKCLVFVFDGNQWSIKDFLPAKYETGYYYQEDAAGPSWMPITVSPVNADHIYIGNVISWRTFDGGTNWETTFTYYGEEIHPDCHDLKYAPDGQILYLTTDGGFYKITNPGSTNNPFVVELNNGLTIGTITKIALTYQEEEFTLIGEIDCGSNMFDPLNLSPNPWRIVYGGDGAEQEINMYHSDTIYTSTPKNRIRFHNDRGANGFGSSLGVPSNENAEFIPDFTLNPNNQNEIYANFTNLYMKQHPNSWVKVSDLAIDFNFYTGSPLTALCIAPNNHEYIYVAVESFQAAAPSEFLLFKTTSGGYDNGCTSGCWSELFPPNQNYITAIAVSPYNENEIWVSYSGYIENNKVKYFDGNSWSDFSTGLPNLPVNNIIFNYGSDNGIFAATDNGVYYRDATMNQWESFKENLPNVSVSELEINYGFNKIVAGTFGRGLWESPLPCTLMDTVFSVDSNQSWKVPMRIDRNVVVAAGAILTIENNAVIHFVPGAKLIIEPGGKLILNGGTLTNACDSLWGGIEVWGDRNAHQYPDINGDFIQGVVELKNGAVVENAISAVELWKPDDYSSTGGIIHASNATFRNNTKSVHALHFTHIYIGRELSYNSHFTNCTFEITADYQGEAQFYKHIDLNQVNGIKFSGCDFSLEESANNVSFWNSGIAAYDAGFRAEARCTSNIEPCSEWDSITFNGFYRGIDASNIGSSNTFSVSRAQFINNTTGIHAAGVNNFSVLFSDFYIGHNSTDQDGCLGDDRSASGIGISTTAGNGFAIEENYFTKAAGASAGNYTGIRVAETSATDEIYLNQFQGLSFGIYAEGKNWEEDNFKNGLSLLCNEFTGSYRDIDVEKNPGFQGGIQSSQGSAARPAGNEFINNTGDYKIYNNGNYPILYYYDVNSGTANPNPSYEVGPIATGNSNNCPSHYGGGGPIETIVLTDAEKLAIEQEYLTALNNYNSVNTLYESLQDGGDTEGLKTEVETAWPDDTWELRAELLGKSPHLSAEVLKTAADKTEVLPESIIFEIMAANPDELRNDELLKYLEDKEVSPQKTGVTNKYKKQLSTICC